MSSPVVIRPRLGALVYLGVAAMCAVAFASLAVSGNWGSMLAVAPLPVALLGVGYVTLLAPSVVFDGDAVELRNPLRTTRVPYSAIESWDTHRSFSVTTDAGTFSAWAAPPPDRLGAERTSPLDEGMRDPRLRREADGALRTSAAPGSPSGDAALTLEHRLREGGRRGTMAGAERAVKRTWNLANIAILLGSVVAAVALAIAAGS